MKKKPKKSVKKAKTKKPRIGLALSSGGAKGISQLSIIHELQKKNVPINIVAGASAGALIGAYFCLYGQVDGLVDLLIGTTRKDLINLIDLNNPRNSILKGKKIEKFLDKIFEGKTFKDLILPFRCVVTNANTGKPEIIKSGKISKAVFKSMSFPFVLPFSKSNNQLYFDGGVTEPLPINCLFKEKCDFVIGVNSYEKSLESKTLSKDLFGLNSVNSIVRTIDILDQNLIEFQLKEIDKKHKNKYFIFSPETKSSDFFRFDLYKKLIQKGEKEFKKKWPSLNLKLRKLPKKF